MRSRTPGNVTANIWYLGSEESGVYFVQGNKAAALINGGMSFILPSVISQMSEFGLDPARIEKFLILHSHFDHVGIVPYFKRKYPDIQVIASEPAVKVFEKPKAIEIINTLSKLSAGDRKSLHEVFDLDWSDDIEVIGTREGDKIDLGGVVLNVFETPGHSNCSITAYEPETEALFASDAVGIPFKDKLFPSMNTNIEQFLQSLEKLKRLPISLICADHCGYITGEEAQQFVSRTIEEALGWQTHFQKLYKMHDGDIDAAGRAMTKSFYEEMPGYIIAPDILEGVFKQIFKYIGKTGQAT